MKAVILSDIHFGPSQDNEAIHNSLQQVVYPYIRDIKPDMIVIAGDDTDDRLSLNQTAARYYLDFVNTICSAFINQAGEPCAVRFIAGTESHQRGQLQSLVFLTKNPNLNVRTYETVGMEEFMGCKILYVPEESVEDKNEYYKEYLFSKNKIDLVFGHGLFDFVAGKSWGSIEERSLKGSPVWSADDFRSVAGIVAFGHIHIAQEYKNKFYYGGSLSRNCQGEEAAKGFLSIYYNPSTNEKHVEFIENQLAPRYITVSLTKNQKDNPVEKIIKDIVTHVEKENIYELRVMVAKSEIELTKLQILRKYFADNRHLGVRIELKKEDSGEDVGSTQSGLGGNSGDGNSSSIDTQGNNTFANRYPEIRDPNDWEFNTRYFAEVAYNTTVSPQEITQLLSKANRFDKGEQI